MHGLILALVGSLSFAPSPSDEDDGPGGTRLPPVEQCDTEAGFAAFHAELRRVVAAKDEAGLLSMLSEDVQVDFGGGSGRKTFAENWDFGEPVASPVWEKLETALARGCAPAGDSLVAPSIAAQFPYDLDAFETLIALPKAALHKEEGDSAEVIARLDWDLMTTDSLDLQWVGVELLDGRKGFVRRDQTVSPLDYRITFQKRGGRWLITSFLAGD